MNNAPTKHSEPLDNDFEIRSLDAMCVNDSQIEHKWYHNLKYTAVGIVFGIVFVKAEIVSWYRIQEMFRLQSFHMYGIIGTAVIVGMISVAIIKKLDIKTIDGEKIVLQSKQIGKGQIIGGLLFGLGWAITGACPGPIFALLGAGFGAALIILVSAIAGTWCYGLLRDKLPH